jgi:hypothetical protein
MKLAASGTRAPCHAGLHLALGRPCLTHVPQPTALSRPKKLLVLLLMLLVLLLVLALLLVVVPGVASPASFESTPDIFAYGERVPPPKQHDHMMISAPVGCLYMSSTGGAALT